MSEPLSRLSWLEIDVGALANNLRVTRQVAGGADVFAVVKADAYGHGAEAAARAFLDAGAARLCVATLGEALALRDAGLRAPILVLFRVPEEAIGLAVEHGIELAVSEDDCIDELLAGLPSGARLAVHVEVETGLGRAGILPERLASVLGRLAAATGVRVAGLWTHFAAAEEPDSAAEQLAAFERALADVQAAGLRVPPIHAAASAGVFAGTVPSYDAVRPGLCLYGLLPPDLPMSTERAAAAASLRPAMALRARPLRVEQLPTGHGVSYGSRWRADRPSTIATLPVGYSDGLPRVSSPGEEVLVHGRRAPIVGTVAMDATMVDATDIPGVGPGSVFTLLGADGDDAITADELARLRTTISWEVVATMAQRLPRVYHAGPVPPGRRPHDGT